jgi:hypothetical protein
MLLYILLYMDILMKYMNIATLELSLHARPTACMNLQASRPTPDWTWSKIGLRQALVVQGCIFRNGQQNYFSQHLSIEYEDYTRTGIHTAVYCARWHGVGFRCRSSFSTCPLVSRAMFSIIDGHTYGLSTHASYRLKSAGNICSLRSPRWLISKQPNTAEYQL